MTTFTEALAHHLAGRWVEASRFYRQIIEREPDHPQALYLLGVLAEKAGSTSLASQLNQQALTSQNLNALAELANELAGPSEFEMAETLHRQIAQVAPQSPAVWNNLGNLYRIWSKPDPACEAFQRAIAADANFAPAYCNLGNALKDRGQIEEAIAAFRRSVELNPADARIRSNLVYACGFSPAYGPKDLLAEATAWADQFETPLLGMRIKHEKDRSAGRKLRIGYVSMDFRNHVVGRNVLPILQRHDRERFEIHCFSTLALPDAMTPLYQQAADHWHECASLDDAALAEKIRVEKIDILVDLSLHMAGNRLLTFARKPAPVQITWAGYPGTTGMRSIDYRITDPQLDPAGGDDSSYSENSIRLPHSFWCYRPMDSTPDVNPLPAAMAGLVTFGCLNHFAKVTGDTLHLWAQILHQTPGSRLLLLCPEGSARTNTLEFFRSQNVSADRVNFVNMTLPEHHMRRYHAIDICLDPLPYTGHTTTLDALWMGVPVVTLTGATSMSRGSVTGLTLVGLSELIAKTSEQYVCAAVNLANDVARLVRLRAELRKRLGSSPICDETAFTRDLEEAYANAWNGLSPDR
jgi:predicted O-linked N-acetylglucosamine transferase (SPINDLY family)